MGTTEKPTEEEAIWSEIEKAESRNEPDETEIVEAAASDPPEAKTDDAKADTKEALADDDADDVWADAKPEQRAAFEAAQKKLNKLTQSERSQRGRLGALQRQLNELHRQKETPAAAKKAADKDDDGDDDIKTLVKEYPEVANPLLKKIEQLESKLASQGTALEAIGTERHTAELETQAAIVEDRFPKWKEALQDEAGNARPEFVEWLNTQPRHIREAVARNANEIVDAEEAADVISRFMAFRSAEDGGDAIQTDTPDAGNGQGNGINRLTGKRQRQLDSAASARSRGPGVAHGIPEDGDPEMLWKQFDEVDRRQSQRA